VIFLGFISKFAGRQMDKVGSKNGRVSVWEIKLKLKRYLLIYYEICNKQPATCNPQPVTSTFDFINLN